VAQGVLSALGCAHGRRGADGRPAPVIHRDVSPQNILISFSGNVKLTDFGIAKARDRNAVTQDGVVKGKAYYMAPEQMYQGRVDERGDLYSFGIVLHEMLTGRRLFEKYSQTELFNPRVPKEVPPPSAVVPSRPVGLDAFVLRLLEPEPERRYQSCGAALAALEELMLATRQMASTERLGAAMRQLFGAEEQQEERMLAQAAASPAEPLSEMQDAPTMIKNVEGLAPTDPMGTDALERMPTQESDIGPPVSASMVHPVAISAGSMPRRPPWIAILIGGGLGLVAAVVGLHVVLGDAVAPAVRDSGTPRALATPTAPGVPDAGVEEAAGPATPAPAPVARVRLKTLPVQRRPRVHRRPHPRHRPSRPRAAAPKRRAHPTGTLDLTTEPAGQVYLGGRSLGGTPLRGVTLPAGAHRLELRNPSLGLRYPFRVEVSAGQRTSRSIRLGTGTLRINAIPWARVYLDGKMLDVTPIKPVKLYPGRHVVELVYPGPSGEQRHRVRVNVRSGGAHKVIHNFLGSGR